MDTESLLKSLNTHKVRYVVIGATAFPVHGYARATLDIDIFIEPTKANARRTLTALAEFGYDVSDLTVDDMLAKKLLIRQYILETDIHPFVAGVTFEQVWRHRVRDKLGQTPTYFASLDDLIKMKEAAGRPKDLRPPSPLEIEATSQARQIAPRRMSNARLVLCPLPRCKRCPQCAAGHLRAAR